MRQYKPLSVSNLSRLVAAKMRVENYFLDTNRSYIIAATLIPEKHGVLIMYLVDELARHFAHNLSYMNCKYKKVPKESLEDNNLQFVMIFY